MIEGLLFPDVRSALFDLVNNYDPETGEAANADLPLIKAGYVIPADSYGSMEGPFPVCLIYVSSGPEGFVDRVERVILEVYAVGELAVNTLEYLRATIVGWDIETPSGYLDKVRCVEVPTDVPYQSDTLNKATAHFDVTVRPIP